MAGKRLLDIAALFNASHGVAQKHLALRARQLDAYNRTSTLSGTVRIQTDRVTETVKAATDLLSRLNESAPTWTAEATTEPTNDTRYEALKEDVEPDSLHETSSNKSVAYSALRDGTQIQEAKAVCLAPPDASISPIEDGLQLNASVIDRDVPLAGSMQKEKVSAKKFHNTRLAGPLKSKTQVSDYEALEVEHRDETNSINTNRPKALDHNTPSMQCSTRKQPISLGMSRDAQLEPHQKILGISKDDAEGISRDENGSDIPVSFDHKPSPSSYQLRESKVPSSRIGRLWNYGGLAAGMLTGVIGESLRRASGSGGSGSYILSAGNMDRLVTKLSRMRGAALKLGQMISFQDSKMLPPPIQEVLQRVQDRADYMPPSQRNKVLSNNLGPNWRKLFSSFDEKPLAAASIGQVHSATLSSNGVHVAVKIQYPGVADSIDSDLSNLAILLTASRLLPKGLFLDKTIANARIELAWECDYIREAECGQRFQALLADETEVFTVPKIYPEASGKQVLTMEFMNGVGVTRIHSFSQKQKDWIGTQILRLCLREITEFRFMQTDPNWTNFLYNAETEKLELLDFGASREYPEHFITTYTQLLAAASKSDRDRVIALSTELGYLTGQESKAMVDAHIGSVLTLAEPFLNSSPEIYDFRDQTITERVKELIPLMIKERLAPPPEETYSLHRKLSGAFLLCARLGSRVKCRELFEESMRQSDWRLGVLQL